MEPVQGGIIVCVFGFSYNFEIFTGIGDYHTTLNPDEIETYKNCQKDLIQYDFAKI